MTSLLANYFTEKELAAELGITQFRWRHGGAGPDVTRIGEKIYFSHAAVQRWLVSREQRMPRTTRHAARRAEARA
jgi:hypothetical protein